MWQNLLGSPFPASGSSRAVAHRRRPAASLAAPLAACLAARSPCGTRTHGPDGQHRAAVPASSCRHHRTVSWRDPFLHKLRREERACPLGWAGRRPAPGPAPGAEQSSPHAATGQWQESPGVLISPGSEPRCFFVY